MRLLRSITASVACMWAFLVMLQDGQRVLVPDACGFSIEARDDGSVIVFRDKSAEEVVSIPTGMVVFGVYIPDDRLI